MGKCGPSVTLKGFKNSLEKKRQPYEEMLQISKCKIICCLKSTGNRQVDEHAGEIVTLLIRRSKTCAKGSQVWALFALDLLLACQGNDSRSIIFTNIWIQDDRSDFYDHASKSVPTYINSNWGPYRKQYIFSFLIFFLRWIPKRGKKCEQMRNRAMQESSTFLCGFIPTLGKHRAIKAS